MAETTTGAALERNQTLYPVLSINGRAMEWQKPLWEAIHAYVRACGGDPDRMGDTEARIASVNHTEAAVETAIHMTADILEAEAGRLTGWIREIHYDAECHHDGERPHELAHALAVEIPHLCTEALDGKPLPQITHGQVPVCTSTGEVGCLDCTEGICDGMTAYDWRTFCACGGDDVYGEMHHFDGCALHDPDDD